MEYTITEAKPLTPDGEYWAKRNGHKMICAVHYEADPGAFAYVHQWLKGKNEGTYWPTAHRSDGRAGTPGFNFNTIDDAIEWATEYIFKGR